MLPMSVAQVHRARCCPFAAGPWWMLSDQHKLHIERIQATAASGKLAVLYGAGVSMSSGLPSWGGLLGMMAERAGFDPEECDDLAELDYLDQPVLIAGECR
jgi:hypothetical protein